MKLKNLAKILFLGLILVNIACVDKIDFERPETIEGGIVIQGKLTKGNPSVVNLSIRKVFGFKFDSGPRQIAAQSVHLLDEEENQLELSSIEAGIYTLEIPDNQPNFKIEYEKAYKVKIVLRDGRTFESTYDTLYAVPTPTSLRANKQEIDALNTIGELIKEEVIAFKISTPYSNNNNNNRKSYFLWEIESIHQQKDTPAAYRTCRFPATPTSQESKICYITLEPVNNYKVLNTNLLTGNAIADFELLEIIAKNYIFSEGFYLTVYQQSVSAEAYEYWNKVSQLVNRNGTIFEAPAGQTNSNIFNQKNPNEEVFGYFFTTESQTIRVYVPPSLANNPSPICPSLPRQDGSGPGNCCNCLTEQNSTIVKPDWWIE